MEVTSMEWKEYKLEELFLENKNQILKNSNYPIHSVRKNQEKSSEKDSNEAKAKSYKFSKKDNIVYRPAGILEGYINLVSEDSQFPSIYNIIKLNTEKVIPSFLCKLMRNYNFRDKLSSVTKLGVRSNISNKLLGKIKVLIPPLEEQVKISNLLDKISENISNSKIGKELSLELFKSAMDVLLTNPKDSVEYEFAQLMLSCKTGRAGSNDFLNSGNYKAFSTAQESNLFSNEYKFDGDYIIMNRAGNSYKCEFYNGKFNTTDKNYAILTNSNIIDNHFLKYYLDNNSEIINNKFFRGTGLKTMNIKSFKKFKIKAPAIDSQKKIYDFLDKLSQKVNSWQNEEKFYTELLESVMDKFFKD
jgi:restriction endonuclease S subunit